MSSPPSPLSSHLCSPRHLSALFISSLLSSPCCCFSSLLCFIPSPCVPSSLCVFSSFLSSQLCLLSCVSQLSSAPFLFVLNLFLCPHSTALLSFISLLCLLYYLSFVFILLPPNSLSLSFLSCILPFSFSLSFCFISFLLYLRGFSACVPNLLHLFLRFLSFVHNPFLFRLFSPNCCIKCLFSFTSCFYLLIFHFLSTCPTFIFTLAHLCSSSLLSQPFKA